ncbi:sensor histidine kinase [Paenibacillus albiflavus]|uniref:sensor histidine kinase n=1 Tax=Paenibacillus albiflavus TaxID=2545760 RepID=UPI0026B1168A
MNYFYITLIVLLLLVIIVQHQHKKKRTQELLEVQQRLHKIINRPLNEKLLLLTNDPALQTLLAEINRLLIAIQHTGAVYARTENSMRRMLSNISHDLKTPLTVVIGYLEMLRLNPDLSAEERNDLIAKVHTKTVLVLDLIHTFFDLAKLEAGDNDMVISKVQLNELCRMSILQFYEVLTAKGIEVDIDIPDQVIAAKGNEEALQRILNNLISNAIAYGSEGKVLGLTLHEDEESAYIQVWDRGKGISEIHKDAVFERMYTLEDSRNRSYQGSGLGLTITKRLIEKMGGKIHLNSKPYERTVFIVELAKIKF